MPNRIKEVKDYATSKEKVIEYLIENLENPTRLKIQNSLYLLWAFYAGSYGNVDNESFGGNYPHSLFEPNFYAGKYGVYDPDVDRLVKEKGIK
ncbi:hypothetical protein [Fructobacillus tropaeoli]|uniref:Hypothetical phage protein n=1 Tax=Fructobacillus tropaeoli TaxID=709323 RepID=A0A3F3H1W3_9LACO|nr:hypothetical protein [Fructobacillus tropaeoli]GAP04955.1 hypothetical phage protein [Fructobacillus tropaeoli]